MPLAGGQSAYGALDNTSWPAETDASYQPWLGSNYYDSATDAGGTIFGTAATVYTVVGVPEPATCALLGLGSLFMIIRRRMFLRPLISFLPGSNESAACENERHFCVSAMG